MKFSPSLRFVVLWLVLLAGGSSVHAQDAPPSGAGSDALPPNVVVFTGPAARATATETPRPTSASRVGEEQVNPRFLGATSCSSSLCHGGGSAERNAYTTWNKSDPHRRAAATLAGTRAERIAAGLSLGVPTLSARCTECHTPLAMVPEERLAAGVDPAKEGVSCESCHGPAQNWVRSHTRRDFSPAQNVLTGVREERGLYDRAGTCVACHQVLAPDLLAAGHPALFFELDSQMVAEPRHWIDRGDFFGPQAWLTGQAVALRELSWTLRDTAEPLPEFREQGRALRWLLQRTVEACQERGLPGVDSSSGEMLQIQAKADALAHASARLVWTRASIRRCLVGLAATDQEFLRVPPGESPGGISQRAQRLAMAFSRLAAPLQKQDPSGWGGATRELDKLFALANAPGKAFDGVAFGEQLRHFREALAVMPND